MHARVRASHARRYLRSLAPYRAIWSEVVLSAALEVIQALGAARVYYHTYDSSVGLKHLSEEGPPRSLYVDLPRRFCFTERRMVPRLLLDCPNRDVRARLAKVRPRFFVQDLPGVRAERRSA